MMDKIAKVLGYAVMLTAALGLLVLMQVGFMSQLSCVIDPIAYHNATKDN
jgi:hypothetical protein